MMNQRSVLSRRRLLLSVLAGALLTGCGGPGPVYPGPETLPLLDRAKAVIVVAGMEGALGSVVGGLTKAPVIAVPTSVGYGANLGGVSALLSMLNSCAAGMAVVNIDNGFGAGYMAAVINAQSVGQP